MNHVGHQVFNVLDLKTLKIRKEYGLKYSNDNIIILAAKWQGQIVPNIGDLICLEGDEVLYIIQNVRIYRTKFKNEIYLNVEEFNDGYNKIFGNKEKEIDGTK